MEKKILATVGEKEITNLDVENALKSLDPYQAMHFQTEEGKKQLLEDLVNQELFYMQAKEDQLHNDEDFKAEMKKIEENMLKQYAINKVLSNVTLTEEEKKAFFEANKSKFNKPESASAKHILVDSEELANDILRPIRDIVSEGIYKLEYISILEANRIIQDSHPEFEKYKSAGRFVYKDYNREEIAELLEIIKERAEGSKYAAITLYGLGGVIKEVKNDNTAFYHRNANFILGFQSVWEDARFTLVNRRWLVEKLKYIKTITEGAFINFPCFEINDKSQTYEQEYYGGNTNVLKLIKEKYDKDDFFNFEQDIRIERKLFYDFLVE